MELYVSVMMFLLGAIIGSFLNVFIYRLHTGKTLGGRSHCMSCGTELRWFELVPLVSFVGLRARCRSCSSRIPSRYFFVELLTGATFVLTFLLFKTDPVLLAFYLLLMPILIAIVVYDIRHTIIPDELTLSVGVLSILYLAYTFFLERDVESLLYTLFAGVCASLFFFLLWYVSKGRWIGLGDAKLALPLGVLVGFPAAFTLVVVSFWIGAILSLFLLLFQYVLRKGKTPLLFLRSPLTIKSEVPFAPFLVMGFVLVQFFNANIFDITLWIFLL